MNDDEAVTTNDDAAGSPDGESWLAEQARLVLLEDGN